MTALADAHIKAQARLRELAGALIGTAWDQLGQYNEADVPRFLGVAIPIVSAAQRQSAVLANAYLARATGRQPLTLDFATVTGAAIRNGTPPEEVYRRPFVNVWSSLGNETPWDAAVAAGRARATSTVQMDVQNTMRHTVADIGDRDQRILGYKRVPDAGACPLCRLASGQLYKTSQLMPVHNHCGCSVEPIFSKFEPTGDLDVSRDGVSAAVENHGELGPLLADGADHFTRL